MFKPSTPPVRPQTPRSNEISSPKSNRPASAPPLSGKSELELVRSNLDFFNIDKAVPQIRDLLVSEKEALLEDIEYVTQCLDDETKFEEE
jgi:hypothetical protein